MVDKPHYTAAQLRVGKRQATEIISFVYDKNGQKNQWLGEWYGSQTALSRFGCQTIEELKQWTKT